MGAVPVCTRYSTGGPPPGRICLRVRGCGTMALMIDPLPFVTYTFVMSITPGPNNVMLTASGADLDGHGRRLGFRLLRKPFQIDHLEAAVKQALGDRKIEA